MTRSTNFRGQATLSVDDKAFAKGNDTLDNEYGKQGPLGGCN